MIDEKWRYFAPGGALTPGGPSTWYILDWDQRRIIAVTMDEEQESEDVAIAHLRKHIDALGPDVYAIHVSQDGELVSVSTNPDDDETTCVYYPPLRAILPPPDHVVKTVLRSDLLELDRLTPNIDLVSYTRPCAAASATTDTKEAVVFKYYFLFQFLHKLWHEMNLWICLPPHPNLVPFDRLVVDELHGRVVGFTSVYIPGGTIGQKNDPTYVQAGVAPPVDSRHRRPESQIRHRAPGRRCSQSPRQPRDGRPHAVRLQLQRPDRRPRIRSGPGRREGRRVYPLRDHHPRHAFPGCPLQPAESCRCRRPGGVGTASGRQARPSRVGIPLGTRRVGEEETGRGEAAGCRLYRSTRVHRLAGFPSTSPEGPHIPGRVRELHCCTRGLHV